MRKKLLYPVFAHPSFALHRRKLCLLAASSRSFPGGKTVAFTCKSDLCKLPFTGGIAVRLTQPEAHEFMPVYSPNGGPSLGRIATQQRVLKSGRKDSLVIDRKDWKYRLVPLNATAARMQWDSASKSIFLLANGRIIKSDSAASKQDPVNVNGDMNLDVTAKRIFMFDHVWRRTRNSFYTAGYHSADRESMKADYQKYLPHISNIHKFTETFSESLDELNVSHSGASYVNTLLNADATASPGIVDDPTCAGNGLKTDGVLAEGPLAKAGSTKRFVSTQWACAGRRTAAVAKKKTRRGACR